MASSKTHRDMVRAFKTEIAQETKKYDVLRDLDIFVLDNSIRESTVGKLQGQTPETKWKIYREVKKLGIKNIIVACFVHMTSGDEVFIQQLCERGEDRSGLFALCEVTEGTKNKIPDTESVPTGLLKMAEVGLYNVIFELDLSDVTYDFDRFPIDDMCALLGKWIVWCHDRLHPRVKVLVNFRDLPDAMSYNPERVFRTVEYLAQLPEWVRPFGLLFEEPRGTSVPEECGIFAKYIRKVMMDNKWEADLLVHVHEKYGYCDATALQVLMSGANGIWGSICTENANMGNASSCVTLTNLIRLGNKKVLDRYNCTYLRQAAINVTRITTGQDPPTKQPIYGARAVDVVFDLNNNEFDLTSFFGEHGPVRITALTPEEAIRSRLIGLYGANPEFTIERVYMMKKYMLEDLNREEECMSEAGLAMLFDRSGGALTPAMKAAVAKMEANEPNANNLIADVKITWDSWHIKSKVQEDNMLDIYAFYNGFMAPYFASYKFSDTRRGLWAIGMDAEGQVDWKDFLLYLKWAVREYPMIKNEKKLLDVAFRKGILPAVRYEILQRENTM
ncbi:uncharacterized protein LOC119721761 [Patiria miniata]|uniref:Uncharacterized protein n=1 Tax=Patiria miniata TaxID=46514 RepID=A0A913Z9T9_PATMI|nr:uncharacterized protein LOC119721761 [Patiria miniata]